MSADLNTVLDTLADLIAERVTERLKSSDAGPSKWMTTTEVAQHTGLSKQHFEIARRDGNGPKFTKLRHAVRYDRKDVDEYMRGRKS